MSVPGTVYLTRLKLTDFRNYQQLALELDARHVVLTGQNGAGKTNLMEAISFLSPGRGLRRAAYNEVSRVGSAAGFAVFAHVEGMAGPVDIGTSAGGEPDYNGSSGRKLRINSANARSSEDLAEHLRIVWLTPAMDGLFTGAASDRRRFLDRQVLSIDPAHGRRVLDFERAMRSRNRLLSEGRMDRVWLDGIEAQMAELGVAIALARRELVAMLASQVGHNPVDAAFPQADIRLDDFLNEQAGDTAADFEDGYIGRLRTGRARDGAAGRTLAGPHRSDLLIRYRAKDMDAARCSTGEQKALLVGLVLAHARLTGTICGHPPVILLDEIAAHLDENRRAALFDLVDSLGCQAFMTGTDQQMFSALGARAQFFDVRSAQVTPLDVGSH